jgi:hypothetical protein
MKMYLGKVAKKELDEIKNLKFLTREQNHKLEEHIKQNSERFKVKDNNLKEKQKMFYKFKWAMNKKNQDLNKKVDEVKEKRGLFSIMKREEFEMKKELQEENLSWNLGMLKDFQKSIIEKQAQY